MNRLNVGVAGQVEAYASAKAYQSRRPPRHWPGARIGLAALRDGALQKKSKRATIRHFPRSDSVKVSDYRIAPSILSADFARLGEEVERVLAAGADFVHVDVMDNHFVPNLTFGPEVCRALRRYGIRATLDVHLMIEPVDRIVPDFAEAGADIVTFHAEASRHLDRTLQLIRDHGCKAGLAFNPATPLTYLDYVLDKVDLLLIMSVNPGFGGQAFIPSALDKLRAARRRIDGSGHHVRLEVDGGVTLANIREVAEAGADTFVAGSAIFRADDYRAVIDAMHRELRGSRPRP